MSDNPDNQGQVPGATDGEPTGTAMCLGPEQWQGEPATVASDLYGAGAVIHYLLTGYEPRRQPSEYRPGIQEAWDPILSKVLRANPARRFATAVEFAECLEANELAAAAPLPRAGGARVWAAVPTRRGSPV